MHQESLNTVPSHNPMHQPISQIQHLSVPNNLRCCITITQLLATFTSEERIHFFQLGDFPVLLMRSAYNGKM